MVVSCVVVGCTSRHVPGSVTFHRIPKDVKRRELWINAIRRKGWIAKDTDRVCGRHFVSGNASGDPANPDYVPSLSMGYTSNDQLTPAKKKARFDRSKKRGCEKDKLEEEKAQQAEAASILVDLSLSSPSIPGTSAEPSENVEQDSRCETETHDECIKQVTRLRMENMKAMDELARLQKENTTLKKMVQQSQFGEHFLIGDQSDLRTVYFTGLPSYASFVWLVTFCTSILPSSSSLSPANIVLLTLMKLRLNLQYMDISFRFNISVGHVSDLLNSSIPALARHLNFLIQWPAKDEIIHNMPKVFRETYSNCNVIIDCTEVFIECPANLTARSSTWSNYKHNNTLKFLVACSPCGAVTFVSRAYGGRTSDKVITQQSGFLNMLKHGDLVLADRGFLIGEELAACGATLVIPDFTRGKKQLSAREVERSRKISRVRIHVERLMERLKNFKILSTTMNIALVPQADNIMCICAAISNLHPKLVK